MKCKQCGIEIGRLVNANSTECPICGLPFGAPIRPVNNRVGVFSIKIVIGKLKELIGGRPDLAPALVRFEFSTDIDDSDEDNIELVTDVYPSQVDSPFGRGNDQPLHAWRQRCKTILSGVSITVGMSYLSANGNSTNRKVEIKKIFRDGPSRYFTGFCFFREAFRTFREDRIAEITDLGTGEVFPSAKAFFDRYGIFNSPKMEELQVILHVLIYLARADRKFVEEEKAIISDIISQYCSPQQKKLVEDYAFCHKPTKQDYLGEVGKLAYMDAGVAMFLIRKAEELIKADGKVAAKEQELFDLISGCEHG